MIDWSLLAGDPAAPLVGPFPHRAFLETWWRHRPGGDLEIVSEGGGTLAVVGTVDGVRLAGEADLTDYHAPLGAMSSDLAAALLNAAAGRTISLDSLPAEAATVLQQALEAAGGTVVCHPDEACMILDLVDSGEDGWEVQLRSKDRHEVRRKRRRFETLVGPPCLERAPVEFGRFVDLHRLADGDKGEFMTSAMAGFFEDLLGVPGARLDVVRDPDGVVVAAAFGFEDADAYYLYNSAFDPSVWDASPGIVLVDRLIQHAADSGRSRFDFLKGGEVYKRRMGAAERPLFRLEVTG